MRYILVLWAVPIILFWGWFGLSANDINFGNLYFSRGFHDHMMNIYGSTLGIEAGAVPGLIAGVFFFDTLIVLGIAALRWHKYWLPQAISFLSINLSKPKVYREFDIEQTPAIYPEIAENGEAQIGETTRGEALQSGQELPAR